MDKMAARENCHSYWKTVVEEQEKSGMSQAEFCRQRNLVLSQFGYYRSLFKRPVDPVNSKNEAAQFKLVHIREKEEALEKEVKVVLPNGFQCFIPPQTTPGQIKQLIGILLLC